MMRAYTNPSVDDLYFDAMDFYQVECVNLDEALFCELESVFNQVN